VFTIHRNTHLDRGGMRRVWLRGRENVQKRYLIHVAGYNLGLIIRLLTGAGTPRVFRARAFTWLQPAMVQILQKARLIDRHQRAEAAH
jgi:hypothetical protein